MNRRRAEKGPRIRLGITGFPLGHTKSPALHRGFLRAAGLRGSYDVLPFDPSRGKRAFFKFLDEKRAEGYRGLNVTIPFKGWAYEYCFGVTTGIDGRCARTARAANTIVFGKSKVLAANTDSAGLWDDIEAWARNEFRAGFDLVVVGTGGAARGALAGVQAAHPMTRHVRGLTVWGRDAVHTRLLQRRLKKRSRRGSSKSVLVLWCLPPLPRLDCRAIWGELESLLGQRSAFLYDLNYGARAEATRSLVAAHRRRAGLGMLRRQAEASFALWLDPLF